MSHMEVGSYNYSSGDSISEVLGCHLLGQMSSQWGSQKLLQGLVSHELTTYLSVFHLFKLNELWTYYQKHVNQIILNHTTLWSLALQIFEAFVQILLIVNLSLNQTLLMFLLCVMQTWILNCFRQFLCERLSSFNLKGF